MTVRQKPFGSDLGVIHEAVVTGRKVGADEAFWAALAHDEAKFRRVVQFVTGGNGFEVAPATEHKPLTVATAIRLMGKKKVVTAEQAAKSWNREAPNNPVLPYTEDEIKECVRANQIGEADWRLMYAFGISLREQREYRGIDRAKQPCYYSNTWWLESAEDSWAAQTPDAGRYFLLDFYRRRFNLTAWANQDKKIASLGCCYERANEAIVAEAVLSNFDTHRERLLEDWYHWGTFASSNGNRVCVGFFDSDGFDVNRHWPEYFDNDNLGVVVVRKPRRSLGA